METIQNSSLRHLKFCSEGLYFLATYHFFQKVEFSAEHHFVVARFYLKIKQLRGQKDVDNLIQTDNKLFWKIHPQHVSLTLQCCPLTTLSKWTIPFSAINLKRFLYVTKQTQVPLLQIFAGRQASVAALEPKLLFLQGCSSSFYFQEWISTSTQILKLPTTQQNLTAIKIHRHTKASSVSLTFFPSPSAFNRN